MASKSKRIAGLILASLMVATSFAGCGSDDKNNSNGGNNNSNTGSTANNQTPTHYDETNTDLSSEAVNGKIKLKVWGSQADQEILKKLCDDFANTYKTDSYTFEFEYGVVGEPDAATQLTGDPDASADVFAFANDQITSLVKGGYLNKVLRNKDDIIAANDAGSIASATVDGELYAYPLTSDNGFFLYYDKTKLTEEEVKSWNKIAEVCETKGYKYHFDLDNGWYAAGWFFGAGASITPTTDAKTNVLDFNKYPDVGAYLREFAQSSAFVMSDDNLLQSGFTDGTAACGVSGVWMLEAYKEILGDNLGAVKLPEFTTSKGTYQMGSFGGYKFIGVNSFSKAPGAAACLAEWLSNEASQAYRFEQLGYGASNLNVQKSDAVSDNIGLVALAAQSPYAKPQLGVADAYWKAMEAYGLAVKDEGNTKTDQELLDSLVAGAQEA